jgi:hypothetical protein
MRRPSKRRRGEAEHEQERDHQLQQSTAFNTESDIMPFDFAFMPPGHSGRAGGFERQRLKTSSHSFLQKTEGDRNIHRSDTEGFLHTIPDDEVLSIFYEVLPIDEDDYLPLEPRPIYEA